MASHWLTVLSWCSLGAAALSLVAILADIYVFGHRQRMRVMEAVWPVTALYFGPIAVWAYYRWARAATPPTRTHGDHTPDPTPGRHPMAMPMGPPTRPLWQSVAIGVSHCGAGCTLGDVVGEVLVFSAGLTLFGARLGAMYAVDFALAFLLGIVFQYFAVAPMRGLGFKDGVVAALKADTLSLIAFEVGMFGWMALMYFVFRPRFEPNQVEYWFLMQLGMVLGFVTSYPANWWLIKRGVKERM
ncbi:membrane protein [Gemmatimonadetes bacterium T265]|nr:membrane protein [Gemmatimonadetes bacterium T265]